MLKRFLRIDSNKEYKKICIMRKKKKKETLTVEEVKEENKEEA